MSSNKPTAVVVYSGGLDSTVLLHKLVHEGVECNPISFFYGQRHQKELEFALANCERLGLILEMVDLPTSLFKGSSQTTREIPVPEGHYAEESMKQTIVPNRNMVLLSLAGAYAQSRKLDFVAYAAHAGDHAIYPDCRDTFVKAMDNAFFHSAWSPPKLEAPFLYLHKYQIVQKGYELDVPFRLTWSCYKGGELHCGKCGTCVERKEAFEIAEVKDPTQYE